MPEVSLWISGAILARRSPYPGVIEPNWNRRLTLRLLRREAEQLIQGPGDKADAVIQK
jgi:hypothetical protein